MNDKVGEGAAFETSPLLPPRRAAAVTLRERGKISQPILQLNCPHVVISLIMRMRGEISRASFGSGATPMRSDNIITSL